MPTRFNLKGNASLIIFQKYLKYIDISVYSFFSELITKLIEKNTALFIDRVEKGEVIINPNSRLFYIYEDIKSKYVKSKIEETPEFNQLSGDDLDDIMKKLSEAKELDKK